MVMIDPNAIPDILPLIQRVVMVQNLTAGVPEEVVNRVVAELKRYIEAQPVGSDNTQLVFMLESIELFKEYRDNIIGFLDRAAKEGLFTQGDSAEYDRILSNLAGPGTDTKQ